MMDDIYSHYQDPEQLVSGQLALLLAILASAAAMYQYFVTEVQLEASETDALHSSLFWTNSALEMLEISRRTSAGQIEDVQATILLSFLLYHLEGFSVRTRGLFSSALCAARELSLHKIDGPGIRSSEFRAREDPVYLEVKRRIIWHVVATDWLLALSGGPQEGTYTMQTRHMLVNRPRNVDDDDITQDPSLDQPISSPSTMSYYLQRINLADLCRSVADAIPLLSVDISAIDYKDIITLDRRFEALLEGLPYFLKTDEHNRKRSEDVLLKYPQLRAQRFSFAMVALTRRCKLHQPFLIRGSVHQEYKYSREVSLRSARSVIKMKRVVEQESGPLFGTDVKLTGISHHIFMATIVLVTDLCFNRGREDDDERKTEVIEALKLLEEAKCRSQIVSKFVESLENVLRKHKVRLLNRRCTGDDNDRSNTEGDRPLLKSQTIEEQIGIVPEPWDSLEDPMSYPSEIDSVWRDYVQLGPNLEMPEWDSLFSDLDSTFH
ncbi:hypothetical protein LTR84_011569 [Exophiala bonariae]|uniref:Transcription factor domain-containing protein n=1 Tax=Exophiala bonariae TaxID=1690606 RepID=A0AAV9NGT9_9EURO|nr:hypothetical protein LTR84_011569 [Exophiala bonariae]